MIIGENKIQTVIHVKAGTMEGIFSMENGEALSGYELFVNAVRNRSDYCISIR